jgi:hypothetical protein
MINDSRTVSSKIKELIDSHNLGRLSDEKYHYLLKSQIIGQWKVQPLNELGAKKKTVKVS